ncbi:hypothetical protein QQ045_020877 [Rhodiola kirilowii]
MDGRLVAGSHIKHELIVINADDVARIKSIQEINVQTCQLCGDEIEINADGELFVACNECAFPACRTCYQYERREGSQSCPQCKTRYKRIKGFPRVEGDEEEDNIDDVENELDYGTHGLFDEVKTANIPVDKFNSRVSGSGTPLDSKIPLLTYKGEDMTINDQQFIALPPPTGSGVKTEALPYAEPRPMVPEKDITIYGYGSVTWKDHAEDWRKRQNDNLQSSKKQDGDDDEFYNDPELPAFKHQVKSKKGKRKSKKFLEMTKQVHALENIDDGLIDRDVNAQRLLPVSLKLLNKIIEEEGQSTELKVRMTDPSKVIHIRNVGQEISENDLLQLVHPFGGVSKLVMLRAKNQALIQMQDITSAISMLEYYSNVQPSVRGRNVYMQFSSHQELTTMEQNTQSRKGDQDAQPNRILLVSIHHMLYPITVEVLHQVFSPHGFVEKIVTFQKSAGFQALIQYQTRQSATSALNTLQGRNIYDGCCQLDIQFSNLTELQVNYNNDRSRDFTNPSLPTEQKGRSSQSGYGDAGGMYGLQPHGSNAGWLTSAMFLMFNNTLSPGFSIYLLMSSFLFSSSLPTGLCFEAMYIALQVLEHNMLQLL